MGGIIQYVFFGSGSASNKNPLAKEGRFRFLQVVN
jgi:hypothetical protein